MQESRMRLVRTRNPRLEKIVRHTIRALLAAAGGAAALALFFTAVATIFYVICRLSELKTLGWMLSVMFLGGCIGVGRYIGEILNGDAGADASKTKKS